MIDKNEVPSSIDFYCSIFSEALNINFQKSRYQMKIGLEWEDLCFKIAKDKKLDVISHLILANRSIPDMAINHQNNSKYETLIECKKSLYFAKEEWTYEIDINNNPTSSNYLPFCRTLQYWILEDIDFDPNFEHLDVIEWIEELKSLEDATYSKF
ncbi:hypothetical protein [Fredinandcohnia quinoae]|uniref:Uncharacterized protein n=1 Tax=Fredinandcohnia quinoae TaxID=2918902 RepID=A0AAW5E4S6_9BACI|nr:hypothetical protein [Fredinandcohnia sp. SECRCQ15]MCH1627503.1 hypothetical protein [Fredinandcohnia sp. SECRCQ15]